MLSKRSPLYKRHRFPPEIIQHVVWLYQCFNLSSRDIEDLMAGRGVGISYESIMPTIEPSFHINQPGSESEVCGDSNPRIRPNGF